METKTTGRIWRTVAIIAVICAFSGLILLSITSKPSAGEQAWKAEMTIGDSNAKNHYIMYTDLLCPYCDVFSREIMNHWDEFQEYLAANDILFEVRLTDILYESYPSSMEMSRDAAEAAYCAASEGKFWEYYHGALSALWTDYQSKGIGSSKSAPAISNLPNDYWQTIGHKAELGADFDNCLAAHTAQEELDHHTLRAAQAAEGLPSFKFNKFTTSGFSDTWDWEYVKLMLDAGLNS